MFFTMLTWFFLKWQKFETFKRLIVHLFCLGVWFLAFTKGGKGASSKQFWRKFFFSSKFYFQSSIWIYKLSASGITENSSHCYPLTKGKSINMSRFEIYFQLTSKFLHHITFLRFDQSCSIQNISRCGN